MIAPTPPDPEQAPTPAYHRAAVKLYERQARAFGKAEDAQARRDARLADLNAKANADRAKS